MTTHTVGPAADAGLYPSPRRSPWTGFALAAEAAVRQLNERLGMDLWLVTHVVGDDQIVVAAAGNWVDIARPNSVLSWHASFCLQMVERRAPMIATDVHTCPAYLSAATGIWSRVRAYVGVPLEGDDGAFFGTLCALSGDPQPEEFMQSAGMVELVGQMLSTILAHEQIAHARSQEAAAAYALAERDRLTGLLNRRGWDAALARQDELLHRYGSKSSVLVVDVDGLKEINDTAGHHAGDELLIKCAQVLKASSRPGDIQARIGGDEFAVLAIECDPRCVQALMTRLRVALRTAAVPASIGSATRRPGERLAQTTTRADATMYAIKKRRRHRAPQR